MQEYDKLKNMLKRGNLTQRVHNTASFMWSFRRNKESKQWLLGWGGGFTGKEWMKLPGMMVIHSLFPLGVEIAQIKYFLNSWEKIRSFHCVLILPEKKNHQEIWTLNDDKHAQVLGAEIYISNI